MAERRLSFDRQVEEARDEVEASVRDATADLAAGGIEAHEDDVYLEVAGSVLSSYPPRVAAEVRRRLGF